MTPIGDIAVTRVVEFEGAFSPLDFLLPGATPDLLREHGWLQPGFVDLRNQVVMSFHSYLVRTPRHVILIDACAGNDKERPLRPSWHRQNHPWLDRLADAGARPEEVDFVFCTHMHADHVGWNTRLRNGRWVPTFPNARYIFSRLEYRHWEALALRGEAPNHGSFTDSVLPVMEAKQADLVDSDHEIEAGIHLEAAYGHTPGGCFLHARSRGRHGVFTGDAMHTPVQLADPSLSSRFCADPLQSAATRRALCERYADTDSLVFTGHFPGPDATRLGRAGSAFRPLS